MSGNIVVEAKSSSMTLDVEKPSDPQGLLIEAWASGYMLGSLIIMFCVTVANMRRRSLLHKLILLELFLGTFSGTFILTNDPVYHWYLSSTTIFLFTSWSLHNVIAWMKNKPLLSRTASRWYIGTVIAVQPYWVVEIVFVFLYFTGKSDNFRLTRPYEALFRDPWWIFTSVNLVWNIKTTYSFGVLELIRVSPRFGIVLGAMALSIVFIILDLLTVTHVISAHGLPDGINPFWPLGMIFKCLTDTIVLDDFKTALDRLSVYKQERMGSVFSAGVRGEFLDVQRAREGIEKDRLQQLTTNGAPLGNETSLNIHDWQEPKWDEVDLESGIQPLESARIHRTSNG